MAQLPAICEQCGAVFKSRLLNVENVTNVTLVGNREQCPNCGRMTGLLEGTFTVQDGVITFVDGPSLTIDKLLRIQKILAARVNANLSDEEIDAEIERETGESNFTERFGAWAERIGYVIDRADQWKGRAFFAAWLLNELRKVLQG